MRTDDIISIKTSQYIPWIDVLKGFGIISVVTAHVLDPSFYLNYFLPWFNIPIFFCISGYLYKSSPVKVYFKKKAKRFLVPYVSFFFLIGLPFYINKGLKFLSQPSQTTLVKVGQFTWKMFFGGNLLVGKFGVFWFITCLFLTQQAYNFIYQKVTKKNYPLFFIMLGMYILALIDSYALGFINYPWSINIVFMSIGFFYVGHMSSKHIRQNYIEIIFSCLIIFVAIVLDLNNVLNLRVVVKFAEYGIPIFSFIVAVSCINVLKSISIAICHYDFLKHIKYIFSELGKASLVIMFLHLPVHFTLYNYRLVESVYYRIAISLILPLIFYKLFDRFSITRKYFIGI